MAPPPPSILVIGATGRLGLQIIRATARFSPRPHVHAFTRHPQHLAKADRKLCDSIQPGDATHAGDLSAALAATGATVAVVAIGSQGVGPTTVRHDSATALMDLIAPGARYDHVRALVVSSVGAGGTTIRIGLCLGTLLAHRLRYVLGDHDAQEAEFIARMSTQRKQRLLIVRPTALYDGKGTGHVAVYERRPAPSGRIARKDLAEWIVHELCVGGPRFGRRICITGERPPRISGRKTRSEQG